MIKEKDIFKVECMDLNHRGAGVCTVDGFTVFVDGLLVGEIAEIEIIKMQKTYGFGKIINIINQSENRIKPVCKIFGICGGCEIMHLVYKEQLAFKKKMTKETLRRLGNLDVEINEIIGMDEPYYYRNKVQIPFQTKNNKVICGFYKQGTHEVVPLDECFIQPTIATDVAIFIKNLANEYKLSAYDEVSKKGLLRHVLIRKTINDEYMLVLITNGDTIPNEDQIVNKIVNRYPIIKSIIQNVNTRHSNVILGEESKLLFGTTTLIESLLGLKFILSHKSFFQTNHIQTEKLYSKVLEYANPIKEDVIVDGYCGVGSISLLLATKAKEVYGIEIVPDAIKDAKNNARLNDIKNVKFILGKTEEEIFNLVDININTIVIDPPRKGCDKILLDAIMKRKIKKIVYVSCDVATLARDLNILNESYNIKEITLFDMFPQTSHVESCVLLERR